MKSKIDGLHNCSREELKQVGVYTITSKINNRIYVGSTRRNTGVSVGHFGFKARWEDHVTSLIRNKHYNKHLQRHVNKYGIEDLYFEILEVCDVAFVESLERYWINQLDSVNTGFNQCYTTTHRFGKSHPGYIDLDNFNNSIILLYKLGLSIKEISKEFKISSAPIKRVLISNNVTISDYRSIKNIDVIYKHYINSNLNAAQIANIFNICLSTLLRNFSKNNLLTKIQIVNRDINIIFNRYKLGESVEAILAPEYKVDRSTITKLFKKYNLK